MKRFPLASKIALLTALLLLMLLPISAILDLIRERTTYRQSVIQQIADSTSGPQTLIGPILVVPYETSDLSEADNKGHRLYTTRKEVLYFLPETLDVTAVAQVEARKLGIYQAQVYDSRVIVHGRFNIASLPEQSTGDVKFGQPYLSLGIADTRGIRRISPISINGNEFPFKPGTRIQPLEQGLHAPLTVALSSSSAPQLLTFRFELGLQGTRSLSVVPVGETSNFSLQSNWPHPNFVGNFLPTQRSVSSQGFDAQWSSTWFANNMNQRLVQAIGSGHSHEIQQLPAFSATMIETVDQYQLSERSVKYAILFIGLTFIAFFLFETLKALRLHPIQYLLVSAALILFYLLLLALSEHIGFNAAYLSAALACTGLITYGAEVD